MTTCLVGLGSNLGDRAATLDAAVAELEAAHGVESVHTSAWQMTLPVGGDTTQPVFLNGAARCETSLSAYEVLELLHVIEQRHGRERSERWGDRTLDLDLLLFGAEVIDSPTLTVPHPRMSFRRFVLEPAAEIAGEMINPTIGFTIAQLLDRLEHGANCLVIVSHDAAARGELAEMLTARYGLSACDAVDDDSSLWPRDYSTWLLHPDSPEVSGLPKLTVEIREGVPGAISPTAGRGPTLQVPAADGQDLEKDVHAAVEAVWPHLGPSVGKRLQ